MAINREEHWRIWVTEKEQNVKTYEKGGEEKRKELAKESSQELQSSVNSR